MQVEPRVESLKAQWAELESSTTSKGERLFDANRHIVFEQVGSVPNYSIDIISACISDHSFCSARFFRIGARAESRTHLVLRLDDRSLFISFHVGLR